jgi:hypothetical protein
MPYGSAIPDASGQKEARFLAAISVVIKQQSEVRCSPLGPYSTGPCENVPRKLYESFRGKFACNRLAHVSTCTLESRADDSGPVHLNHVLIFQELYT